MESEGDRAGFGERLRRAREAKGLSRADLSEELRLTQDKIRALEEEDFSSLPEYAFVRGYVRNYADAVGVDPDEVLADLQRGGDGDSSPEAEDRPTVIPEPERPWIEHPWRVVWASLTLLLAVSVGTLWLVGETRRPSLPGSEKVGEMDSGDQADQEATPPNGTEAGGNGGTPEPRSSGPTARSGDTGPDSRRFGEVDSVPREPVATRGEDPSGQPARDRGRSQSEPDADSPGAGERPEEGSQEQLERAEPDAVPSPEPGPAAGPVATEQSPGQETEAVGAPDGEAGDRPAAEAGKTDLGSEPPVLTGPSLESDFLADLSEREAGQGTNGDADNAQGEGTPLPEDLQALRIRTWAKSWMEVEDARERLLLRRLVPAEQDVRLYGEPPFRLKVGNAAGVQLYFQGEPLAPLGDPGQVVELTVDEGSATVPESEVGPPAGLDSGSSEPDGAAGSQLSEVSNPPASGRP